MVDFQTLLPMLTQAIGLAAALAFVMFGVKLAFRVILNAAEGHWHDIWM